MYIKYFLNISYHIDFDSIKFCNNANAVAVNIFGLIGVVVNVTTW